jgi:hypothetical protein
MRWYNALLVALGLAVGGLLSGGVYEIRPGYEGQTWRYNRLTGAVDVWLESEQAVGWYRLPAHVNHDVARALELFQKERAKRP